MEVSRLSVRVLAKDKRQLRELAREEGEPVAVMVRRLIRRGLADYNRGACDGERPPIQEVARP